MFIPIAKASVMRFSAARLKPSRWFGGFAIALTLALTFAGASSALAQTLLIYQANPTPGAGLPSLDDQPYEALQRLTTAVADQSIAAANAVGIKAQADIAVVPGGYKLRSDPSIVMRTKLEPRQATLLAAALGYVYRQESVLVLDLDAVDADQFFVRIHFDTTLTGALADAFFHHAATIAPALGEGYTAFDNDLLFINLRDDAGKPYGGLGDEAFKAALIKAVASFTPAKGKIVKSGLVEARLVGNDWQALPNGGTYRTLLPIDTLPALDAIAGKIGVAVGATRQK